MLEDLRSRRIRPGDAAGIAQIGPILRHPIKNAEYVSLVAELDGKIVGDMIGYAARAYSQHPDGSKNSCYRARWSCGGGRRYLGAAVIGTGYGGGLQD